MERTDLKNQFRVILVSFLKSLLEIFPVNFIALVLYPSVVGLIIHFNLVDFREIVIDFVWLSFLLVPFFWWEKKVFYYVALVLSFVNGLANVSHWVLVKAPLSATSMFVLFNTNQEEAFGFVNLKSSFVYLLVIPYFLFFFKGVEIRNKKNIVSQQHRFIFGGLILISAVLFIIENGIHQRLIRKGVPVLVKSFVSFHEEVKAFQELKTKFKKENIQIEVKATELTAPQTYLLIIGESANRNHFSLYGYKRKTNPLLTLRNDLFVFDNVVSAYSHTLTSVTNSLSEANLENGIKAVGGANLTEVFKAAGFKTFWLSNQSPLGIWDNLITLFAEQSDRVDFVNISSNSSFENNYNESYDSRLFEPLAKALSDTAKNKFIVLHLMGSHSTYNKRYPQEFAIFRDNTSSKTQLISEYDNSILYNDFVVDSMLKLLTDYSASSQANAVMLYISDHGENVYDGGDYAGHDYVEKLPKSHVEIPFLLWLSPQYKISFPSKTIQIQERVHASFVTDDLFHAMIDLGNLHTGIYVPERSLFDSNFNQKRKRILEDRNDYDIP